MSASRNKPQHWASGNIWCVGFGLALGGLLANRPNILIVICLVAFFFGMASDYVLATRPTEKDDNARS